MTTVDERLASHDEAIETLTGIASRQSEMMQSMYELMEKMDERITKMEGRMDEMNERLVEVSRDTALTQRLCLWLAQKHGWLEG